MIILFTSTDEYEALRSQLEHAGWDTGAHPGRQLAYNGLLHALGSAYRDEHPAVHVAVLYQPERHAGVAGLITYREWADCLEIEYLGVAVPGQGAGSNLMRF